ncbi:MAG TPA: nucleotidyltransferase, partial [candidate division WOR-3 bacterium]|nr:nucleotidyltransferase [candidate division WOR-3 bacterium]
MKCLIIAAGRGKRIRKISDSKPLTKIYGLPLIERVILTARRVGVDEFVVVTGYNGKKVRKYLDKIKKKRGV